MKNRKYILLKIYWPKYENPGQLKFRKRKRETSEGEKIIRKEEKNIIFHTRIVISPAAYHDRFRA